MGHSSDKQCSKFWKSILGINFYYDGYAIYEYSCANKCRLIALLIFHNVLILWKLQRGRMDGEKEWIVQSRHFARPGAEAQHNSFADCDGVVIFSMAYFNRQSICPTHSRSLLILHRTIILLKRRRPNMSNIITC